MLYIPKRKPRKKQAEASRHIKGCEAFALFMEMRCGKTKVVVDDFGRMLCEGKVLDLLIMAPAAVYHTWVTAIHDDMPDDILKNIKILLWESGKTTPEECEEFLAQAGPRILLVNVEALSVVKDAQVLTFEFVAQRPKKNYGVVDESTVIKNPQAERTKIINDVYAPRIRYKRILSGLPTPRSPLDTFEQFRFLDLKILGYQDFKAFSAHYAVTRRIKVGKRSVNIVVGYKNVEELPGKIKDHSFRVLLSDCTDLKKPTYAIREVEMTPQQKRIYADLKEFATAEIKKNKHITATMVVTQMLRLQQVLLGRAVDEHGVTHQLKENRIEGLIDLFNETAEKAVVFCSYDDDIYKIVDALEKEFGKGSCARFWGGNRKTREAEEKVFKTKKDCRFMVSTTPAGKFSRDWSVASIVAFYSSTNNLENRMQGESRVLAVGKNKAALYVDFICRSTVEEKLLYAMKNKLKLASAITGDNWKEWVV